MQDWHKCWQRTASLTKLLGYGFCEESLVQALQNLSSSESMDFRALLLNETSSGRKNTVNGSENHARRRIESDAESGFEDGSLLSKSMTDDTSTDHLEVEQLLLELQSVALEWKSFRNAVHCSCALPFEQHSKKVNFYNLCLCVLVCLI